MTTTDQQPTAAPTMNGAPNPAWHATALPDPLAPGEYVLLEEDGVARLARIGRSIDRASTWLFCLVVAAALFRAATGADPYRGGLSVLGVALVAAVGWGFGEWIACRVADRYRLAVPDDDTDGQP